MANITLKGNPVETVGILPANGTQAPQFTLVKSDLSETGLGDFAGKTIVLNIFPSLDTPVCAASVRRFNQEASSLKDTAVLCISADLPFAHKRFCEVEGLNNVVALSTFRSPEFGIHYGLTIANGPLRGLMSRAVIIIGSDGTIRYSQQVPEIVEEPDYDAALKALA